LPWRQRLPRPKRVGERRDASWAPLHEKDECAIVVFSGSAVPGIELVDWIGCRFISNAESRRAP
jgi:hypothetical protein